MASEPLPLWFVFALACALFYALEGAWAKRLARGGFEPVFLAWVTTLMITPVLWAAALRDGLPELQPGFWLPFAMSVGLNTAALPFYFRSLAAGELSVVFPLLALTPMWMLLTTHAITGEFPSPAGLAGVGLATAGCYGLRLDAGGALEPLKRLWAAEGSRLALATSVLWSFTANFDKAAVEASSRFFYPALHGTLLAVTLLPWALRAGPAGAERLRTLEGGLGAGLLGLFGIGIVLAQFAAIDLSQATYVIAVKRAGIVPGVLIGWKLFGEPHGAKRLGLSVAVAAGLALMAKG